MGGISGRDGLARRISVNWRLARRPPAIPRDAPAPPLCSTPRSEEGRLTLFIIAVAVVAVAIAGFAAAQKTLYDDFVISAARFKATAGVQDDAPVTEEDLRDLPEPMARHLRFSGVLGRKRISAVHVVHSGRFKPGADRAWMSIDGEYFLTTKKPSFFWYGKVNVVPGISFIALDSYAGGSGRMVVKLMSVFRIVDDGSRQVSASAFGRAVAELTMAPTFFLDRRSVRCARAGSDQVRCTVTDGDFSTHADLFINADGSLNRIELMRYFDRGNGKATLERFTGKGSRPKNFGGRMLASRMDGVWNLSEGDLHYVSFDIDRVDFE